MAIDNISLKVGESVYWIHRKRSSSGYGQKEILYSLVEVLSLTENRVQVGKRQFVLSESLHKLDSLRTLEIPDYEGTIHTLISDSIRTRSYGGGNYGVEGIDLISGCNIRLLEASGKGSITACKMFIYSYKPEQREIDTRTKQNLLEQEEATRQATEIKKIEEEKQRALDHIKSKRILNQYLEQEGNTPLIRLHNAFLSKFPKQIFMEAERCIAEGIEVDVVMQEGMMNGYLKALKWLYELHLQEMIFFPEIIVYNKKVFQHFADFKNLFNPTPMPFSIDIPILVFSNPECHFASFWGDGIFSILDIPTIPAFQEYNLQKVENLIKEKNVKTVLCYIVKDRFPSSRWSNDITISLLEKLHSQFELKLLVFIEDARCQFDRFNRIPSKNIIHCHSPIDITNAISSRSDSPPFLLDAKRKLPLA